MKRVIRIRSHGTAKIEIVATIGTNGWYDLSRDEVESIRNRLADALMLTLTDLPYTKHPISKMAVSR